MSRIDAAKSGERFDLSGWRDRDLIRLVRAFARDLEAEHGAEPNFPTSPMGVDARDRRPVRANPRRAAAMTMTPGYWMHETTGALRPAVVAYLAGEEMTAEDVAAMRAYLRQWIAADFMDNGDGTIDALRAGIDGLTSREAIAAWLDRAYDVGIDPL